MLIKISSPTPLENENWKKQEKFRTEGLQPDRRIQKYAEPKQEEVVYAKVNKLKMPDQDQQPHLTANGVQQQPPVPPRSITPATPMGKISEMLKESAKENPPPKLPTRTPKLSTSSNTIFVRPPDVPPRTSSLPSNRK